MMGKCNQYSSVSIYLAKEKDSNSEEEICKSIKSLKQCS